MTPPQPLVTPFDSQPPPFGDQLTMPKTTPPTPSRSRPHPPEDHNMNPCCPPPGPASTSTPPTQFDAS
eukprot:768397-Hanusia_phi.AAC.15